MPSPNVASSQSPGNAQEHFPQDALKQALEALEARAKHGGCSCGGGAHPPDSHLWTVEDVSRAARRSVRQVYRDRTDNPSCPLHGLGQDRGSRLHVWSYEEVRAYLAWITRRYRPV